MEYTIRDIIDSFNKKEITIYDLTKQLFNSLKKIDSLNCFVSKNEKNALEKAKKLDNLKDVKSLIHGIPYVAKDLIVTKDITTTASSDILSDFLPCYNAKVIETLEKKGMILFGKTTTDELGMGGTGLTAHNGKVYNPWNKEYISGGSSSGSAALVGSGVFPFALGTDTGDSIRKPASYCGVVGFKPTYASISRVGLIPYSPSFDTIGYFTRNINDAALMFNEIIEYDANDFSMQNNNYNYNNLSDDIKGYKVAYIKEIYDNTHPEIKEQFNNLLSMLKNKGAIIKKVSIDIELLKSLSIVYYIITCTEAISSQSCFTGICFGKQEKSDDWKDSVVKTRTKYLGKIVKLRYIIGQYASSKNKKDGTLVFAKKIRRAIYDETMKIFKSSDILIGPAVNNETKKIVDFNFKLFNIEEDFVENFLLIANFSGIPSLTLPLSFWKKDNMPYGVNINSMHFDETKLFNIGLAIERITKLKNLNPNIKTKEDLNHG